MKKATQFLTAILVVISFTSCDDLTDVNFSTTITERIPLHIVAGATDFDQSIILSLDNDDTHDYLNTIKNVDINSLTYRLIDFSGDENAMINVQFYVGVNPLLNNNITVKTTVDAGTVFEVTDAQELVTIANALESGHQVTARYVGSVTDNDEVMDFKVEVTMNISVTADPI